MGNWRKVYISPQESCSQSENFHLQQHSRQCTGHLCKHGPFKCVFQFVTVLCTFEWRARCCQRADTIECAWDVDVFVWHTTCVPCWRMCRLNSYGLGGYTNSQDHFVGELFQRSVSNVHINTHKHKREGADKRLGGIRPELRELGVWEGSLFFFFSHQNTTKKSYIHISQLLKSSITHLQKLQHYRRKSSKSKMGMSKTLFWNYCDR